MTAYADARDDGDIGRLDDDGFLYILDRKKDMIKPGGENVYSPEVESMILGHPAVLEASVIGVPHDKWGETIRAVVVCRPDHLIEEMELIAWCREGCDALQMSDVGRCWWTSLPKGGTGKNSAKNILRERYGFQASSREALAARFALIGSRLRDARSIRTRSRTRCNRMPMSCHHVF